MSSLSFKSIYKGGLVLALLAGMIPVVAGCSQDQKTYLVTEPSGKIRVMEGYYSDTFDTQSLNEPGIRALADAYQHHGDGPMRVAVTYDPQSRENTARMAAEHAAELAEKLRKAHVPVAAIDVLPVPGQGQVSKTIVEYASVSVREPENCESMGAVEGQGTDWDKNYKLGCTINTQLARQIARPADLKGQEGLGGYADGGRLSNVIGARYRSGLGNEPLDGESVNGDDE